MLYFDIDTSELIYKYIFFLIKEVRIMSQVTASHIPFQKFDFIMLQLRFDYGSFTFLCGSLETYLETQELYENGKGSELRNLTRLGHF